MILGDLVADQFLRGTIARVSREAPVFILRHDETETLPGSAANAAANVASLGGNAVMVGFIGTDANGVILRQKLEESRINCDFLVTSDKFQTTTKARVLAGHHYAPRQQIIRIDYENKEKIEEGLRERLRENFQAAAEKAHAIIISDYNYGVADAETTEIARQTAKKKNIPLVVDSRFCLENFSGATSATPNQDEVEQILGKDFTEKDCIKLCERFGFQALLVTRGNQGIMLVERSKKPFYLDAVGAKEPVDVTGAGDTVIAAYALGLASGLNFKESAELANHAGGIVVMKKGTATASLDEIIASVNSLEKDANAWNSEDFR